MNCFGFESTTLLLDYEMNEYLFREKSEKTMEARALLTAGQVGQACSLLQAAGDHR
jgi:hypothetical protein